MRIGSAQGATPTGGAAPAGMGQGTDSVSKNIQNQIAKEKQKLQELTKNKELAPEEKMKKKQEIMQKISQLNQQLKQRQMEMRKEKQKAQDPSADGLLGPDQRAGKAAGKGKGTGMSKDRMEALASADTAIKQAKAQGSVNSRMEGRAGVLEAEIKTDGSRGQSVAAKQEELAEVRERAQGARTSQMDTLARAGEELKGADETKEKTSQTSEADKNVDSGKSGPVSNPGAAEETEEGKDAREEAEDQAAAYLEKIVYRPVDIRL